MRPSGANSCPKFATLLIEGQLERAIRNGTIVKPPVILFPSGFIRILLKMLGAYAVVLTVDHAAQAREVAFDLIC